MEEETCATRGGRYEATDGGKDAERWENGSNVAIKTHNGAGRQDGERETTT